MVLSAALEAELKKTNKVDVLCHYAISGNGYNGQMGARISSIFVILLVSSAFTVFPVVSKRIKTWHIPFSVYLFARHFGTGVILATAFIHLLDPAYKRIGPKTCVGSSGRWADYSWCAAIVLASIVVIFLMDLAAEVYVERKYATRHEHTTAALFQDPASPQSANAEGKLAGPGSNNAVKKDNMDSDIESNEVEAERGFWQQISGFLILEFGIIFHSIIIGLNLGVTGEEFVTLYPVLVFHQSFEGLGIGARMSAIPFPPAYRRWLPWTLCALYGLTTPISIAIGLGLTTTYQPNSKTSLIFQGVLNAISAGILIYSSLVELLARDFLFDPDRTKSRARLVYMVSCTLLGACIMCLIGKWA